MQNKSQPVSILEGSSTEITEKRNSLTFFKINNSNSSIRKNLKFQQTSVRFDRKNTVSKTTFQRKQSYNENNRRLTLVLFLINISFSAFTMPIVILQIIHQVRFNEVIKLMLDQELPTDEVVTFELLKAIFELLQYLNHSINFFLYCLSGSTFRQETISILSYLCKYLYCKFHENI